MTTNDCPICRHVERNLIDHAISEGRPDSFFATNFAADAGSVQWHRENCLGYEGGGSASSGGGGARGGLSAAEWRAEQRQQLRDLRDVACRIIEQTGGDAKHWRTALSAIGAASRLVAQESRLADRKAAPGPRLVQTPEWQRLKARILKALEPYPEARNALTEALTDGK